MIEPPLREVKRIWNDCGWRTNDPSQGRKLHFPVDFIAFVRTYVHNRYGLEIAGKYYHNFTYCAHKEPPAWPELQLLRQNPCLAAIFVGADQERGYP